MTSQILNSLNCETFLEQLYKSEDGVERAAIHRGCTHTQGIHICLGEKKIPHERGEWLVMQQH